MKKTIGNKADFAIEIDIVSFHPWLWGKTSIVISDNVIGHYNEENILGPFINSLYRLACDNERLFNRSLAEKDCKEAFYKIHPSYNNIDAVYALTENEIAAYENLEHHNLFFGENFDDWTIDAVFDQEYCTFLWVYTPMRDNDSMEVRNDIKCCRIKWQEIKRVYIELCKLVPDEFWPRKSPKLN